MIRVPRSGPVSPRRDRLPGGSRLPAAAARHDTEPHDRAATARAAAARASEAAGRSAPNAAPIRLLDTQARGHIGRRVLHQQPNGELTEDSVWRWSSAPDRYLDTALRLELASSPDVRLVDAGQRSRAGRNAARLGSRVCRRRHDSSGLSSFSSRGPTAWSIHRWCEQASPSVRELPGDLAAAAGRLLRRLASEGLAGVARER